jgi:hypothetical protein
VRGRDYYTWQVIGSSPSLSHDRLQAYDLSGIVVPPSHMTDFKPMTCQVYRFEVCHVRGRDYYTWQVIGLKSVMWEGGVTIPDKSYPLTWQTSNLSLVRYSSPSLSHDRLQTYDLSGIVVPPYHMTDFKPMGYYTWQVIGLKSVMWEGGATMPDKS